MQKIKQEKYLNTTQLAKQIGGMKLSQLYGLPDSKFAEFINDIENDPIFNKLMYPQDRSRKAISYNRFPWTDLSERFHEFNEDIAIDNATFDIDSLIKEKKGTVSIIKRIGINKFKKYFLYNEYKIPDKEIADKCKITVPEIKMINDLINDVDIHSEFYSQSLILPEDNIRYSKVAAIRKEKSGSFSINIFSPMLARGKYAINYGKIKEMKDKGIFLKKEIPKLDKLVKNLELINRRKGTIYQVIQYITNIQAEYLETADETKVTALIQKHLADRLHVYPSVICRIIKYRTIEMPWGEEKTMQFFFSNRKKEIQVIIKNLIKEEKDKIFSDEQIRKKLENEHEIIIARRTVAKYREELGIFSSRERNRI
ncbi:hypothetical protein ACFLUV_00405 [Elusimicrobiota bacterium]